MRFFLGLASLLSLLVVTGSGCYLRGFARGCRVGRQEADNWWIRAERQVDQVRQELRREFL